MTYQPPPKGTVLFKAKRETLALLAAVSAMTFAISYAVHKRPVAGPVVAAAPQQVWAGNLADVAGGGSAGSNEPMTSASLVVPAASVALPAAETAPKTVPGAPVVAKATKACDGPGCTAKAALPITKAVAPAATTVPPSPAVPAKVEPKEKPGLMAKLNPMNHLPEAMRHPLDYAGDAVSGWFKRL